MTRPIGQGAQSWWLASINGISLPVPIEVKPGEELSLEWDQIHGVTKEVRRLIEGKVP
jgi:hypothetical protein